MTKTELIQSGFDPVSLRLLLSWREIKKLPIKRCTAEELHEAKCGWYFNPTRYYPKGGRLLKDEQGYDHQYRYVLDIPTGTGPEVSKTMHFSETEHSLNAWTGGGHFDFVWEIELFGFKIVLWRHKK